MEFGINAAKEFFWSSRKDVADAKKGLQGDWPPGFDHLPVTRREPVRNHVFLRQPTSFSERLDACS